MKKVVMAAMLLGGILMTASAAQALTSAAETFQGDIEESPMHLIAQAPTAATEAELQAEINMLRTRPAAYAEKIGQILAAIEQGDTASYRELTGSPWGLPGAAYQARWREMQTYLASAEPVSPIAWESAGSPLGVAAEDNLEKAEVVITEDYNLGAFYWVGYSRTVEDLQQLRSPAISRGAAHLFQTPANDINPNTPKARLALFIDFELLSTPQEQLSYLSRQETLTAEEMALVREAMLAIANAARNDAQYRSNNTYANTLTGDTATTDSGTERLYRDADVMVDLVLNDKLNQAAQIQAEHNAATLSNGHAGPQNHNGEDLQTLAARIAYVNYESATGEAAGRGNLENYPTQWMRNETHYRPFFNVGDPFSDIGFGVAKGSDGNWYVIAVVGVAKGE
ncbi:MAG: hypothetical protein F6J95_001100 [Leptolyngbya sp. SIO1E4]|nr:hypothetical protein [Leptolyngbya sp. SIO1E4]